VVLYTLNYSVLNALGLLTVSNVIQTVNIVLEVASGSMETTDYVIYSITRVKLVNGCSNVWFVYLVHL